MFRAEIAQVGSARARNPCHPLDTGDTGEGDDHEQHHRSRDQAADRGPPAAGAARRLPGGGELPRHVDREEPATAGALGLVEAARRYDESRGVPSTASPPSASAAPSSTPCGPPTGPCSVRNLARRLEAIEQRLASNLGRMPSAEETAEALGVSQDELRRLQDKMFRSVVLALEYDVNDGDEDLTLVEVLTDDSTLEPCEELENRELHSYLRDAVHLLPERHRIVVVGYFLEGRKSQELATFLGVTESRISQLRSEALEMLREGITAQYESDHGIDLDAPQGRVARRKATYAAAIGDASHWHDRIGEDRYATA
ncbi:MAG: sigma factor-like helix-turn-helix DNA-binding protein [Acidimicrobiales bacterium]